MDIDALTKGIGLFNAALSTLKQAKDLLPNNSQKADMEAALERAEREFKLAEAEVAKGLNFELCRKHFPPEIMLAEDDKEWVWVCAKCGSRKNKKKEFFVG